MRALIFLTRVERARFERFQKVLPPLLSLSLSLEISKSLEISTLKKGLPETRNFPNAPLRFVVACNEGKKRRKASGRETRS